MDDLPFSHVVNKGFMRLMTEVCPQYKLKHRKFYSSMICNEMYDFAFSKVKTIVCDSILNCNIVFTTDVWSDTSAGVSLLSLIAHASTEKLKRVNFVLNPEPLEGRHTGELMLS